MRIGQKIKGDSMNCYTGILHTICIRRVESEQNKNLIHSRPIGDDQPTNANP